MRDPEELLRTLRGPETEPEDARAALHALGRALPLGELEALLLEPAILEHEAAEVRRDAACALGVLGTSRFGELIDRLGDADFTVARAAWISLWTITGHPAGLESDALFRTGLPEQPDLTSDREPLFQRLGVSAAQRVACEAMLRDDERREAAIDTFRMFVGTSDV